MALGLAAFGVNASADDSIRNNDRSAVVNDSFNNDLDVDVDVTKKYEDNDTYKLETTTNEKKIDDSFNTTNKFESKVDDSYNTTNEKKTDDSYNTTNKFESKVEDSYNTDVDVDDSFNHDVRLTDQSTNLKDSFNNWSNPVADVDLDAKVTDNKVYNQPFKSDGMGEIKISNAFNHARGVNTMQTNSGAHSIQQVGVSISVVNNTTR